jgi:hypothetical protein
LLYKKDSCEIQKSENRIKSGESSEEGYGSRRAVLPVMMMNNYVLFFGISIKW